MKRRSFLTLTGAAPLIGNSAPRRRTEVSIRGDQFFINDRPTYAALSEYVSWGYFDPGKSDYSDGHQCPPVNWRINTARKRQFFSKLAVVTGA